MANSESVKMWRKRLKQKSIEAFGGKCQCCGYDKCAEALEFHHIDASEKIFSFSQLRACPKKLSVIITELKKCILVCSNCHKELHAGHTQLPKNFQQLDESKLKSEYKLRENCKRQKSITDKIPKDNRKIFLEKEELRSILISQFNNNKSKLAEFLHVTEAAIRKRLK